MGLVTHFVEISDEQRRRLDEQELLRLSRHDLYALAKERQIPGRSRMSREELAEALGER
jgi:hypothetical protein